MKFSRRGLGRARLRRAAEPWRKVRPQLTIRDWYFLGFAVSTIREKRNLQGQSPSRYLAPADPIVQWPRTPPFHGGNTGSNPVRVASFIERPTKQIQQISDVLDVLHERPSARIEKIPLPPIKFFARTEGFSFGRFAFCRNYDAARMRIIRSDHSVPWLVALSRFL
jgi:hypothetical protein